jgi:YaiO family outer membrane protein
MARLIQLTGVLLLCAMSCAAQQGWEQLLREQIKRHELHGAMITVDQRLLEDANDLEARGWRARLLAWSGAWTQAEAEYRRVLERAPADVDMLTGLADVLLWQEKPESALAELDQARRLAPSDPEVLVRRARVLAVLGRKDAARTEYRRVLTFDAGNQPARSGLDSLREESRHELRAGLDVDSFNYTDSAYGQGLLLSSRWSQRWSTIFASNFYQRFGSDATRFSANTILRVSPRDWLNVGGALSDDHGIIPKHELSYEYGHSFRLHNKLVRGLELSHQQRWLWYDDARILTLTTGEVMYLPRGWMWSFSVTAARSQFTGLPTDWQPSGATRLTFPLHRRLTGNVGFAVGSENFALIDQTGRFAARTFAGGLRYQFADNQDITGYVAAQDRSQSRSQSSFGISYGFRF